MIRLLTHAEHQNLIGRLDGMICQEVEGKEARIASLAAMKVAVENLARTTRELPLRLGDFLNAVKILRSLDLPDLQAAAVFVGARVVDGRADPGAAAAWAEWVKFRADPLGYLVRANDATQRAVWTLVERRVRPMMAARESHRIDEHAAP